MRKTLQIGYIATAAILVIAAMMSGCYSQPKEQKIPVRVLILPKRESSMRH